MVSGLNNVILLRGVVLAFRTKLFLYTYVYTQIDFVVEKLAATL